MLDLSLLSGMPPDVRIEPMLQAVESAVDPIEAIVDPIEAPFHRRSQRLQSCVEGRAQRVDAA